MENKVENNGLQLSDLNVSNLPELQGWKEKQDALVAENPYVDIIDNKSYELACKSRTALLKGRTELEKQDKLIASKLTSFRKDVKAETDKLISITKPAEEKQQEEVKRYEGIKEAEKAERDRIEQERVDGITKQITLFETECLELIQKLTVDNFDESKAQIDELFNSDFDYEELEIMYENVRGRIQALFDSKCGELQEKEKQRLENERLAQEAKEAKEKTELQSKRLTELIPYLAFGDAVDMANLIIFSEEEYQSILISKKGLFDADAKAKQEAADIAAAEKLAEEQKQKEQKEQVFEIRRNRLAEIGIIDAECTVTGNMFFADVDCYVEKSHKDVFEMDVIDFETFITDAKQSIEVGKEQKESAERQRLIDEKNARFESRGSVLLGLGFVFNQPGVSTDAYFDLKDIWVCSHDTVLNSLDADFEELLVSIKHAIAQNKREEAEKLEKENAERIKRFESDKSILTEFISCLMFNGNIPELSNEESEKFLDSMFTKLVEFKKELFNEIENL